MLFVPNNNVDTSVKATANHPIKLNIRENKEINDFLLSTPVRVVLNLAYMYI